MSSMRKVNYLSIDADWRPIARAWATRFSDWTAGAQPAHGVMTL